MAPKNTKTTEGATTEAETVLTQEAPTGEAATAQPGKPKRAKVAERKWINEAGEEVSEELATGVRYVNLESGESFDWQTGAPAGSAAVMLACFGALTLMGNVANTRINGQNGSGAEAIADIKERFGILDSGKWAERGEGTKGPKYDLNELAWALIEALRAKGKDKSDSEHPDFLAKLTEDKSYFAKVRGNPDVMDFYRKRTGAKPKDVADLDL